MTVSPSAIRRSASTRIANVEDPFLEEVTDPLRVVLDEAHGVAGLDVLREDEYADCAMFRPDRLGGDETLVHVRGRHPNVDDCRVGPREAHVTEQPVGVLRLGNDVDARVPEKADDPLPGEHDVVRDDYAHGISARNVVPSTSRTPPMAPTRSARWIIVEVRSEPSSSTVTSSLSSWSGALTTA